MAFIKQYERGDTARFTVKFRDENDEIIEPDQTKGDHDVQFSIENVSTEEILVDEAEMEEISDTEFRYEWQTTEGMPYGEYSVTARGSFGGNEAVNRDRVEVVDMIEDNKGQ